MVWDSEGCKFKSRGRQGNPTIRQLRVAINRSSSVREPLSYSTEVAYISLAAPGCFTGVTAVEYPAGRHGALLLPETLTSCSPGDPETHTDTRAACLRWCRSCPVAWHPRCLCSPLPLTRSSACRQRDRKTDICTSFKKNINNNPGKCFSDL